MSLSESFCCRKTSLQKQKFDPMSPIEVKGHHVDAISKMSIISKNKWHHCIPLEILVQVANFHDSVHDLGDNIEVN